MTPRRAGRDTALYMLLSLPGWGPQCHMPIYYLGIPGLGCQPVEPSFPLLSLLKCLVREQPSPQSHKGLPACADKSTTSESPGEAGVKLGDWGEGPGFPVPRQCAPQESSALALGLGVAALRNRDRGRARRWRHAPLHLSLECNVTRGIRRWQRKFKGKTHSYLWLRHLLSDQKTET